MIYYNKISHVGYAIGTPYPLRLRPDHLEGLAKPSYLGRGLNHKHKSYPPVLVSILVSMLDLIIAALRVSVFSAENSWAAEVCL